MQVREVGISFESQPKIYSFNPNNFDLKLGDFVVVDTARGLELGKVATSPKKVNVDDGSEPFKKILRIATKEDLKNKEENLKKQCV